MAKTLKIKLTGLRVFAHHGVFDFERQNGQDFYIDATVWVDNKVLAFNDDLSNTVHYGELAERAAAIVAGEPFDLIEPVAARIADDVLTERAKNGCRAPRLACACW